jgi:hypothetical protein
MPDEAELLAEDKESERTSEDGTLAESIPGSTTAISLDPHDWSSFRLQAHKMLDDMSGYMESIRSFPVWQVIPEDGDQRWDYRRAAVERNQDAVRNLLMARARLIPGRIANPRLSLAAATGSR